MSAELKLFDLYLNTCILFLLQKFPILLKYVVCESLIFNQRASFSSTLCLPYPFPVLPPVLFFYASKTHSLLLSALVNLNALTEVIIYEDKGQLPESA